MPESIPWERMFQVALDARKKAHAPYSNFPVGAALLVEGGDMIPGCNVENSSYGLSVCAERNAVARAVLEQKTKVVALAIVVDTETPCPPCGACRQVLAEFARPDTPVRSRNLKGDEAKYTLEELMPFAFTRDFL